MNRYKTLIAELASHLYEKDTEIGLSLLAAMAGESVLLLGPPGVAKSLIARRIKCAFQNATVFEYLMSRFSTPDEIFGPVSINKLKTSDQYERNVEGYLPSSEIVFLDEVWKAGPAIQNALLTVVNEKIYRNGNQEIQLPLRLLVGASNELPTEGEGLEALWDRFLIRIVSDCIKENQAFVCMLTDTETSDRVEVSQPITKAEYEAARRAIGRITCDQEVLDAIVYIRTQLSASRDRKRPVYVSDRRWKKIVQLLRTSAYMHQRETVVLADLFPLWRCLWNETDEQEDIREIVIKSLFQHYEREIDSLRLGISADLKAVQIRRAIEKDKLNGERRNEGLLLCQNFYYHVLNHGTGNTYIFAVDYRNLKEYNPKNAPTQAVLYKDPKSQKNSIIRSYVSDAMSYGNAEVEKTTITIYRKEQYLFIDGVRYEIERSKHPLQMEIAVDSLPHPSGMNYYEKLESLVGEMNNFSEELKNNMFLSKKDMAGFVTICNDLRKQFAYLRVDIEKIESDE